MVPDVAAFVEMLLTFLGEWPEDARFLGDVLGQFTETLPCTGFVLSKLTLHYKTIL